MLLLKEVQKFSYTEDVCLPLSSSNTSHLCSWLPNWMKHWSTRTESWANAIWKQQSNNISQNTRWIIISWSLYFLKTCFSDVSAFKKMFLPTFTVICDLINSRCWLNLLGHKRTCLQWTDSPVWSSPWSDHEAHSSASFCHHCRTSSCWHRC